MGLDRLPSALRGLSRLAWNVEEGRPRAALRVVLQFALRVALLVALAGLVGRVAEARGHLAPGASWSFVLKRWAPDQLAYRVAGLALEPLAALVSAAVAFRLLDRRPFRSIGFRVDRAWWRDYAFGLGAGVLAMAVVFAVGLAAGWLTVTGTFVNNTRFGFGTVVLLAVVWNVGNGFEEELADRAYLLRNAAEGLQGRRVGARGATLAAYGLSSVLFGLAHAGGPRTTTTAIVNLMVVGAFFGLGYLLTGELATAMGVHTTWNIAQSTLFGLTTSGHDVAASVLRVEQRPDAARWLGDPAFGPEGGLLCPAVCVLGGLATVAWVRYTRGEVRLRVERFQREAP